VFLALREMRRAKLRFGLVTGAVSLLVLLILFQQALLTGLVTQFIGALRNQSAELLVYGRDARHNLEGSVVSAAQRDAVAAVPGVAGLDPLGQGTFTVTANGKLRDAVIFGYRLGGLGQPTTLVRGRLPSAAGEAVASEKDKGDGFAIGSKVRVEPGGGEITIVGLARDANYAVAPVLFVSFTTYEAARRVRNPDATAVSPSALLVRTDGADPATLARAINAQVPDVEALTRQQAVDLSPGVNSVRQSFAIVLGLFYLVVPLVTGLFFLIITYQKAGSLTLLRAIGARGATLVTSLLTQVVIVVVAGIVLAVPLYVGALQGVKNIGVHPTAAPVIVTGAVLLVVALLAAVVASVRVLRIEPVEATTGQGVRV